MTLSDGPDQPPHDQLRIKLTHILRDVWENNDWEDDVELIMRELQLDALRASMLRVTENLENFVAHHPDPGAEALGAIWEARQLARTGPTATQVASTAGFPKLVAAANAWRAAKTTHELDCATDDLLDGVAQLCDDIAKGVGLTTEISTLTAQEFRDIGYLQEVNRLLLHSAGLALEIVPHDGDLIIGRVWDYRLDDEGIVFAPGVIDSEKAERVGAERQRHADVRRELFGSINEPFEPS